MSQQSKQANSILVWVWKGHRRLRSPSRSTSIYWLFQLEMTGEGWCCRCLMLRNRMILMDRTHFYTFRPLKLSLGQLFLSVQPQSNLAAPRHSRWHPKVLQHQLLLDGCWFPAIVCCCWTHQLHPTTRERSRLHTIATYPGNNELISTAGNTSPQVSMWSRRIQALTSVMSLPLCDNFCPRSIRSGKHVIICQRKRNRSKDGWRRHCDPLWNVDATSLGSCHWSRV